MKNETLVFDTEFVVLDNDIYKREEDRLWYSLNNKEYVTEDRVALMKSTSSMYIRAKGSNDLLLDTMNILRRHDAKAHRPTLVDMALEQHPHLVSYGTSRGA